MFKKLFGPKAGSVTKESVASEGMHRPYSESHVNAFYNLLFCDDLSLFKRLSITPKNALWDTLLGEKTSAPSLDRLANDVSNEGRIRALAYNRLRALGHPVPPKQLLGTVVEVALAEGLDVLAAFSEGSVRYFNCSSKIAIFEGQGNPVEAPAKDLLVSCRPVVEKIGPWDKPRLPQPKTGNVRLTFLVSDGLYFGEGPFEVLQRDGMAGPVLTKAANLLQRVVSLVVERESKQG